MENVHHSQTKHNSKEQEGFFGRAFRSTGVARNAPSRKRSKPHRQTALLRNKGDSLEGPRVREGCLRRGPANSKEPKRFFGISVPSVPGVKARPEPRAEVDGRVQGPGARGPGGRGPGPGPGARGLGSGPGARGLGPGLGAAENVYYLFTVILGGSNNHIPRLEKD